MAYILDAIVVGIFVLAVYLGYKRGFIKAISKLAAFVIAAVVAICFAGRWRALCLSGRLPRRWKKVSPPIWRAPIRM